MQIENIRGNIISHLATALVVLFMVVPVRAYQDAPAQPAGETQTTEAAQTDDETPDHLTNPKYLLTTIKEFLATKGVDFGLNLLAAVIIFAVGRWLSRLVSVIIGRVMTKAKVDRLLVTFVQHLSYFALLAFVVIAALDRIGIRLTAAIAVLGAAALAIAFALQGSLSNFAAGILMIIFKPFKVGDLVEVSGAQGTVEEIQVLTTVINSLDNVRIIIPNAQITSGTIRNFTANDTRRVDLTIGISYDDDLKKARGVIEDVLRADTRVLKNPAPTIAVSELGASSVNFVVRPWVRPADYWDVYFDLTERLKTAVESNGLTIPFTQYDVHIKSKTTS